MSGGREISKDGQTKEERRTTTRDGILVGVMRKCDRGSKNRGVISGRGDSSGPPNLPSVSRDVGLDGVDVVLREVEAIA